MNKKQEIHLDVYKNRSELHYDGASVVFMEGKTNKAAIQRYSMLKRALDNGFLEKLFNDNLEYDFSKVSNNTKQLIINLVDGVTSETGRALVGLTFLQMTIKTIVPEQSVRLHKGSTRTGRFSWVDGVPMRVLDHTYNTPFLREKGLLNFNNYGVMMTRSLAENYPYSQLFKADMRGPFAEWISIVDALEDGSMAPEPALHFLLSILINRSNKFETLAENTCKLLDKIPPFTLKSAEKFLTNFFNSTHYSARAFEVVIHGLMQAICRLGYSDLDLVPLSQMRSANKKHGNIGDIELKDGKVIVESWDAKYGKPYLYEELSELKDKLEVNPGVQVAGFVVDSNIMLKPEVIERQNDFSVLTNVQILLFNFNDWLKYQTEDLTSAQKNTLATEWVRAVVETFAHRRCDVAPLDEPCEHWLQDLNLLLSALLK